MSLTALLVVDLATDAGEVFERVDVPGPSLVTAVVVLAVAALVAAVAPRRTVELAARPRRAPTDPAEVDEVADFIVALGEAMVDAGDPVTHVRETLVEVAEALGTTDTEVVVMATAIFVSVPGATVTQTAVASAGARGLRLDQVDDVFQLVDRARTGAVRADEGLRRLEEIRALPAPFPVTARVLGYAVLALGIALILRGGWFDVLLATVLGLLTGVVEALVRRAAPSYRLFLPVIASFGVALTVFLAVRSLPDLTVTAPLIAPLVIFLPGALLTTGVLELSTGQMISGAGRVSAGIMQLVLLALGIVAAAQITGVSVRTFSQVPQSPVPAWASWVGVALFGAGLVVHSCARPRSSGWIILVLYVAFAAQVLGGALLGGILSAFVGAAVMTPVALTAARTRTGPPAIVSFMPAFWLLVPGSVGLVGVAKYLGEDRTYGAASLLTAGSTMVVIALGVLLALTATGDLIRGAARDGATEPQRGAT